jgi:hypothetical protein
VFTRGGCGGGARQHACGSPLKRPGSRTAWGGDASPSAPVGQRLHSQRIGRVRSSPPSPPERTAAARPTARRRRRRQQPESAGGVDSGGPSSYQRPTVSSHSREHTLYPTADGGLLELYEKHSTNPRLNYGSSSPTSPTSPTSPQRLARTSPQPGKRRQLSAAVWTPLRRTGSPAQQVPPPKATRSPSSGGPGPSDAVSRCFLACIGSPCLRHCGHGASIGGGEDCRCDVPKQRRGSAVCQCGGSAVRPGRQVPAETLDGATRAVDVRA